MVLAVAVVLNLCKLGCQRIGRPKPIAPCGSLLAEQMPGPVAAVLDTSGLTDLQHSVLPGHAHDDTDSAMDVDHGDLLDASGLCFSECRTSCSFLTPSIPASDQPARPIRKIPRPFADVEPSVEDLNSSDSVDHRVSSALTQNSGALPAPARIRRVLLTLQDKLQTTLNSFSLYRLYPCRPSFEPDKYILSSLLARMCPTPSRGTDALPQVFPPPYPFANMTVYRLMSWINSGSSRVSETKVATLVKDIIMAEGFDSKHLQGFSVRWSLQKLDMDEGGKGITFPDNWVETDVSIDIPTKEKEASPMSYTIPGFHYRPLIEVIRAAFADAQAGAFHLFPFKRLWKDPLDGRQERIYDELYTSDAWLEAQDDLHKLQKEPGCSLEQVIAGLMFFSDATHLANFGTAKAWPLYAYFRNLTKYICSSPTSGSCHLIGFLPSVSSFGLHIP